MTHWCRIWEDMPDDPKWRLIARRSGATISEVGWIFVHMMRNASCARADGEMKGWNDEVIGVSLDIPAERVGAIKDAMQGLVLEGESLSGWEQRQPKREDFGSADRSRKHRERLRAEQEQRERKALPPAAPAKDDPTSKPKKKRTSINADQQPNEADKKAAAEAGLTSTQFRAEWSHFRDFHVAKGNLMLDWNAAWRTWLSNYQKGTFAPRGRAASEGHESNFIKAARERLRDIENADPNQTSAIASTLPDAAFRIADDPILTGALDPGNAHPILHLEPIRTERGDESDLD